MVVREGVDEQPRIDWRCVSHDGVGPSVAIEDVCTTMLGGSPDSSVGSMGIEDRISRTPSQPHGVCIDDFVSLCF